ncbi:UNVERIFIED_CONTAM: hypothetical protein HDU68_007126 [Siphonaria sp. JEL0065]|nr:hypothetical protein HDU68_007126 [Siphonaria sp. JEL0065]
MDRNKYAPMDLDDNSTFAGWTTPQKSAVSTSPAANTHSNTPNSQSTSAKNSNAMDQKTKSSDELLPKNKNEDLRRRNKNARGSLEKTDRPPVLPLAANSASSSATPEPLVNNAKRSLFSSLWGAASSNNDMFNNNQPYNGISNHLLWPYILMGYLRLAFTLFTMCLSIYLIYQFIRTVQHDLEMKAVEYSQEIIQQVHDCSKLYLANKCSPPEHRVPAMQQMCSEWELCMNRDPYEVGRLKVGAEAIAEVLNRLFEPLSVKTMVNFFISILSCIS